MSQIQDYKEYKKYQPEYASWKQERDLNMAKKVEYLKSNPVAKDEFNKDIERAKIALNAVNVMDEYSQSKAEEMEQVTEATVSLVSYPISYLCMGLGLLVGYFTKGANKALIEVSKGNFRNLSKLIPAFMAMIVPLGIFSMFTQSWGAKKEVQASRQARQEAMDNDLASINQFAILTDEQEKEVQKIASTIKVDKKDAKKIIDRKSGLGIIDSFKTIFKKDDSEKYKANVKLNTSKLSEKEIEEAKKDKDLIQNIVEKIDIASQDYAENAELTVGTLTTVGSVGGGLSGLLVSFLTSKIKSLAKYSKVLGMGLAGILGFGSIIIGTKIQKQASRVGRFKVKNELLENPQQLVYVDEEKYKKTDVKEVKTEKKGYFKNLISLWNDNLAYNKYTKENNVANIQRRRALNQIELSDEQKIEAKNFQQNIFNMFNKLDEKSQTYSEAAEAVGSSLQAVIAYLGMLPGIMLSMFGITSATTKAGKLASFGGYIGSLILPILANILITKDQKNASRVANMLAIKELDDYRYFAHENSLKKESSESKTSPFDKFLNKKSI